MAKYSGISPYIKANRPLQKPSPQINPWNHTSPFLWSLHLFELTPVAIIKSCSLLLGLEESRSQSVFTVYYNGNLSNSSKNLCFNNRSRDWWENMNYCNANQLNYYNWSQFLCLCIYKQTSRCILVLLFRWYKYVVAWAEFLHKDMVISHFHFLHRSHKKSNPQRGKTTMSHLH